MDLSYKNKLNSKLENHTLNSYIILSCILPYQKKIEKAAYTRAKYRNCTFGLPDADGRKKSILIRKGQ